MEEKIIEKFDINGDKKDRLSYDFVVDKFAERGYQVLSDEYVNNRTPMICRDNDGYKFAIVYDGLSNGKKSLPFTPLNPFCVENIHNYFRINRYKSKLISVDYKDSKTPMIFQCHKCGTKFSRTWGSIVSGKKDPLCRECMYENNGKNRRDSFDSVFEFYAKHNLKLLDQTYTNRCSKLLCETIDGYIGSISYSNLQQLTERGTPYPYFQPFSIHTNRDWVIHNVKIAVERYNFKGTILGFVQAEKVNREKLHIECECGRKFHTFTNDFINNNRTRCPYCTKSISSLEHKVILLLDKYNIQYEMQKTFPTCKGDKNVLRFDFYLPKYNLCIEADGIAHYEPNIAFGGEENLIKVKKYDTIKDLFCQDNRIKLLRLPYWEFHDENYKKIIKKELNIIA